MVVVSLFLSDSAIGYLWSLVS